jgi:outer membrane beta-barrel protein
MTRFALGFLIISANLGVGAAAWGQAPAADPPAGEAKPDEPPAAIPDPGAPAATAEQPAGPRKPSYDDIVVVPRKAFLKGGRLELAPFTAISLNDVLIRHYGFGGDLNFYLTDVFSIGVQGQYFVKERSDREGLVGLQYNRTATLNKLKYGAALQFGYVPGYGKFTLFNKYILHWDILVSAGVGVIWTEIIPRIATDQSFGNTNIAPNFQVGTRFFLSDWLTVAFAFRDYVFNDRFEPLMRPANASIDDVKAMGQTQLINNIMFSVSLGFYLPTSFTYRTPR